MADPVGGLSDRVKASDTLTGSTNRLRDATGRFVKTSGDSAETSQKVTNSFKGLSAEAGSASGALSSVTDTLKQMGPEGAAVAAIVTVAATVIAGLAIALYDAAAAAVAVVQQRDALIQTFGALASGANAGQRTLAVVEKLASQLPFTVDKIGGMAKALLAAGIQGAKLEEGVKAIAAATAIMGEEGGAAAQTLIKRFAEMAETGGKVKLNARILNQMAAAGVSAEALAAALGVDAKKLATLNVGADKLGEAFQKALISKGKGALDAMSNTWDVISAKLSEGAASLFEGLGDAVRPFMAAVKDLFSEFYKGSTVTKTAGSVVTAFLSKVFAAATLAVNAIHRGFLMAYVAVLRVAIALAPLVNLLRRIFSNATVLTGLKTIFALLLIPIVLIVAVVGALALAFVALAAIVGTVVGAIVGAVSYMAGMIGGAASAAWEALSSLGSAALSAAGSFISGLVGGISSGVGAVVAAVKALASSAVSALMGALHAHSPSELLKNIGNKVFAGGATIGIKEGSKHVKEAAAKMGTDAAGATARGGKGPQKGGAKVGAGGGLTINVGGIHVDGAGKDWQTITEEAFALLAERLVLSQGLLPGGG